MSVFALLANVSCDIEDRNVLTDQYWDYSQQDLENEEYSSVAVQIALFLAGVVLNLYIFGRILWKGLYSEPTYMLLLNLCVADLVMCSVSILFNIAMGFTGHYSFGNTDYLRCQVCKVAVVFSIIYLVTAFTVSLLSVDRCLYFVKPLKYSIYVTTRRTAVAIVIVWVLSILYYTPALAGYGDIAFAISCGIIFIADRHIQRSFFLMMMNALIFSVVAIILLVTNILILRAVLKQRKKGETSMIEMQRTESADPTQHETVRERLKKEAQKHFKLLRVFGGILLVNFITVIPTLVLLVISPFTSITKPLYGYLSFVVLCIISQVALHPLVEIYLTPKVRVRSTCKTSCW